MIQQDKRIVLRETILLAILVSLTCTAIAWFQPKHAGRGDWLAASSPESIGLHGWILLQSAILAASVVLIAAGLCQLAPRVTRSLSTAALLMLPIIMIADAIMFQWTGERFLSAASWRILSESSSRLIPFTTTRMMIDAALVALLSFSWLLLLVYVARRMACQWPPPNHARKASIFLALCLAAIGVVAATTLRDPNATFQSMTADSARHPFCVFRLIPFQGVSGPAAAPSTPLVGKGPREAKARRELEQRYVTVDANSTDSSYPDILIVVVESFRRELVTAEIMPHLWAIAQKSLHCRHHFSGGNATNHGMFTLINGLEAIWYQQPVTYSPLLNRLFHGAGYEIGFFAGHDDWRLFMMDGFIDPKHYDVFECTTPHGLSSDRRATENAIRFLERRDPGALASKPRLALLYLYATHAIYDSYAEDQIFQPAADDRLRYPYDDAMRDQVWNRYKNSARTVDRFLAAAFRENCVMLVTGDHGESFLEDGTIGHGIRISEYQNMTPAILYAPNLEPRTLDCPTSHADLLPTLLDLAGIRITPRGVFDGVSLRQTSESDLANRVFVTRNYLDDDFGLIGPWTCEPDAPFAYRASLSLRPPTFTALNAIERAGYGVPAGSNLDGSRATRRWLRSRFAEPPGE